jgi:glycosyltransferase involved in cell wall biosynthesis
MLTGEKDGTVGGSQLQQILLGKALSRRGHEVFFVENDASHKQERTVDGIQVVVKELPTTGNVGARAVKSVTRTLRTLHRIDPDVCYRRVLNFDLLPLALYSTATRTRLVYGFAHDSEVTDDPVVLQRPITDNPAYKWCLRQALSSADALVAQNEYQGSRARRRFGGHVEKIPNGYQEVAETGENNPLSDVDGPIVLWVGTLRPWKRPELVLELADGVPDVSFVVVGGASDDAPDVHDTMVEGAQGRDNVRVEGFVPYERVDDYFAAADVFLNTSTNEGFPNTFLQAWAHRTGVVSLSVDPDGVVSDNEIGYVADGSVEDLTAVLSGFIDDDVELARLGDNAYQYFRENHSIRSIANDYERILVTD